MTRKLVLTTERLTELSTAELGSVAGGAGPETKSCPDYTYYCITGDAICGGLSIRPC